MLQRRQVAHLLNQRVRAIGARDGLDRHARGQRVASRAREEALAHCGLRSGVGRGSEDGAEGALAHLVARERQRAAQVEGAVWAAAGQEELAEATVLHRHVDGKESDAGKGVARDVVEASVGVLPAPRVLEAPEVVRRYVRAAMRVVLGALDDDGVAADATVRVAERARTEDAHRLRSEEGFEVSPLRAAHTEIHHHLALGLLEHLHHRVRGLQLFAIGLVAVRAYVRTERPVEHCRHDRALVAKSSYELFEDGTSKGRGLRRNAEPPQRVDDKRGHRVSVARALRALVVDIRVERCGEPHTA
mmetsp:Transcript_52433/g.168954  ORF Transcript_52433/g.168954 Transcript_52433/m.168954 type:complete len:303 (-) Transcript_52433:30-938(-)